MIKDVPGYDGFYSVDDLGNAYSLYNNRFGKRKTPKKLIPSKRNGRDYVCLRLHKKRHNWFISELVLHTFVGPRPKGLWACHGENGLLDNSLKNLYWATPKQNTADQKRDGTVNNGERNGIAKLNEMQVRIIRRLRGIIPQRDAAKFFNIAQSTVTSLQLGRGWGWLPRPALVKPCHKKTGCH